MRQQIGQPNGIVDVSLAPRHVLHMRGVSQHQFAIPICQNVPDRLPVHAGSFHGDMHHPFAG